MQEYYVAHIDAFTNEALDVFYSGQNGVRALEVFCERLEGYIYLAKEQKQRRYIEGTNKRWRQEVKDVRTSLIFVRENPDIVLQQGYRVGTYGNVYAIGLNKRKGTR